MKRFTRLFAIVAALGLVAFGAAACDDDGDGGATVIEIPNVEIGATEYLFTAPSSIPAGLTNFSLSNTGAEDHIAVLFRLDDGVTAGDFNTALESAMAEADLEDVGTFVSGPGAGPGGTSDVVVDLEAGGYFLLCSVSSPEGIPHFALGMIQELEVTKAPDEQPDAPEPDITVTLSDFAFDAPDTISAGTTTFEVVNDGPQPHEMGLVKLDDGFTIEGLQEMLMSEEPPPPDAGPPPFEVIGVAVAMSSGESALTTVDLAAGSYALVCFVADPETGAPHFALGMLDSFTVE